MANRGAAFDEHVSTIEDLKELGSKRLPKMYRDYFNQGAMDLITLRENEEAFNRYKIRPRVLVNVDNIDASAEIFGQKVAFPLGFSPAAMHKLAHPDGELATSRAAANHNIPMALSSYATESIEAVAAQGKGNPYVMQIAIFLSVDVPVLGRRLNEFRNKFVLPEDMAWPNILSTGRDELGGASKGSGNDFDPTLTWDEAIPWLREHTKLPIWLKGIYTADDVVKAIHYGLDGVIVSNHGGRQLDGVPATLDSLRECVPAAKGKIPIALDGGIRRGTDIFKALALGADFVFVGRIPIWGLAYKGQEGVELGIKILMHEFKITMALAGTKNIKEINKGHLAVLSSTGVLSKL
ncbi:FMN-dependent dehydrogenase family protein [Lasiodiplodia theobromae]|uniref:FMN-dependent dehydrogenase family protein n=1 Tax=Lasiodiplodia theobromae TaxID=45133 RepID=UPI0015C2E9D1|nr:FMN-dependent dehydrogenase family protein [Lasiodiplodia theobromae]KAF4544072.1 FMN-dependent dehydrogenase family protein [Lasiodiplodia theobromae]